MIKKNVLKKTLVLNPRQKLFCKEYVIDFIGRQAAIRAGYSKHTSNEMASRLLAKAHIRQEVERLRKLREERLEASADFVVRELMRIAKFDIRGAFDANGNLKDIQNLPEDLARCISSVEIDDIFEGKGKNREHIGYTKKIRAWDKIRALEALGNHFGIFKITKDRDPQLNVHVSLLQIIKDVTSLEGQHGRINVSTKTEMGGDVPRTAHYLDQSCPGDIRIL